MSRVGPFGRAPAPGYTVGRGALLRDRKAESPGHVLRMGLGKLPKNQNSHLTGVRANVVKYASWFWEEDEQCPHGCRSEFAFVPRRDAISQKGIQK